MLRFTHLSSSGRQNDYSMLPVVKYLLCVISKERIFCPLLVECKRSSSRLLFSLKVMHSSIIQLSSLFHIGFILLPTRDFSSCLYYWTNETNITKLCVTKCANCFTPNATLRSIIILKWSHSVSYKIHRRNYIHPRQKTVKTLNRRFIENVASSILVELFVPLYGLKRGQFNGYANITYHHHKNR